MTYKLVFEPIDGKVEFLQDFFSGYLNTITLEWIWISLAKWVSYFRTKLYHLALREY